MLKKLSLAVAVASASLSGMAFAETVETPAGKFDVTMTATFVTDYVSRGTSLNGGAGTIQGSLDVAHESGLYIGMWGSSMDDMQEKGGGSEIDYYVGYAGDITEDVSFDLAVATYTYPRTGWDDDIEYLGSVSAYGATVGVKYRTDATEQLYYYAGYDLELPAGFGLSAAVGQTTFDEEVPGVAEDYVDWSVGISKSLAGLDLALVYADNDVDENDDNVVFSISKTF
jgi:uncharacterized protein (TIGR02001 family)